MALCLVRRTVLGGIRAQALTLTLSGRSRSSFATSDQDSIIKDLNQNSLHSRSLSANPIEKSDDPIKIKDLNHINLFSRSLSANANDSTENSDVKIKDMNQISLSSRSVSDEEIKSLASYVTTRIDESIKHGSPPIPLLFGSEVYVNTDPLFSTYSEDTRLLIMCMVAHYLKAFPEADLTQIYHAIIYYNTMLLNSDDSDTYMPMEEIIYRVKNVVEDSPKVGSGDYYKLTKDSHFFNDLGCDKWDLIDIIQALSMEFKLYIPYDIVSCQQATDYIYENRLKRLSVREFRKHIYITREYGESKSEFRRIFVPGVEGRRNDMMGELHCQALSLNGYKPFKFFTDMKQRFWFS